MRCICLPPLQENTLGQKFVVDAVLWANIAKSGRTDHLDDTLDYRKVYRCATKPHALLRLLNLPVNLGVGPTVAAVPASVPNGQEATQLTIPAACTCTVHCLDDGIDAMA
jgi:hypothetical protein